MVEDISTAISRRSRRNICGDFRSPLPVLSDRTDRERIAPNQVLKLLLKCLERPVDLQGTLFHPIVAGNTSEARAGLIDR